MRKALTAAAIVLLIIAAVVARGNSTGKRLIDTGRGYIEHLAAGEIEEAYSFLSDSLAALLTPGTLGYLEGAPAAGAIRAGRPENRGFNISISLAEGGSRTLWLGIGSEGNWTITGDTSLDNVLGNATVLCSSYARETVIPALSEGGVPEDYLCPAASGFHYYTEEGVLFCSAGHLGNGLDTGGSACGTLRDSLAAVVYEYIDAGYGYPSGFGEMYEQSDGVFGQRSGFHCPDDGYSYYEITSDGVYCPFHGETCFIESPDVAESPDSTSSYEN
ncbi:MAG: hypothetical protein GQ565_09165 [Candidatus Aegiribacteria sp.]|nr:hypothetical protein [Candidatus Aegiribacteria sp.]